MNVLLCKAITPSVNIHISPSQNRNAQRNRNVQHQVLLRNAMCWERATAVDHHENRRLIGRTNCGEGKRGGIYMGCSTSRSVIFQAKFLVLKPTIKGRKCNAPGWKGETSKWPNLFSPLLGPYSGTCILVGWMRLMSRLSIPT